MQAQRLVFSDAWGQGWRRSPGGLESRLQLEKESEGSYHLPVVWSINMGQISDFLNILHVL